MERKKTLFSKNIIEYTFIWIQILQVISGLLNDLMNPGPSPGFVSHIDKIDSLIDYISLPDRPHQIAQEGQTRCFVYLKLWLVMDSVSNYIMSRCNVTHPEEEQSVGFSHADAVVYHAVSTDHISSWSRGDSSPIGSCLTHLYVWLVESTALPICTHRIWNYVWMEVEKGKGKQLL